MVAIRGGRELLGSKEREYMKDTEKVIVPRGKASKTHFLQLGPVSSSSLPPSWLYHPITNLPRQHSVCGVIAFVPTL